MNYKKGFSLIELVVVIGVLAVIMVTVVAILFSALRSRTRVETGDILEQNGSLILNELRNNILNSNGENVSCLLSGMAGVGNSIAYVNRFDGMTTTLLCREGAGSVIASSSAGVDFNFNSSDVRVSGCNSFVSCDTMPSGSGEVAVINFNFVLSRGDSNAPPESYSSRNFGTKVVIRK